MRFLSYPLNVQKLVARAIRREAATRYGDAQEHTIGAWLGALGLVNPEIVGWLDPELSLDDEAQLVDFLNEADQSAARQQLAATAT